MIVLRYGFFLPASSSRSTGGWSQTQTIPGIGIENPKFPSIGIGIEKLILLVFGLGIDLKRHSFPKLQPLPKRDIKTPIVTNKPS